MSGVTWIEVALARALTTASRVSRSCPGVPSHGLDQIRDQIGAPLILVVDVRPLRLRLFLIGRNVVDPASREQQAEGQNGAQPPRQSSYSSHAAHQCLQQAPPQPQTPKPAGKFPCGVAAGLTAGAPRPRSGRVSR
jgi:hypothetical protein